jgi:hypothetical protein
MSEHEDQLEIEVSAEIEDDAYPEVKAPSAGRSFHLSPARSSAFSTPSRSPSRHSSFGAENDLDDDVPSAAFTSFSQSPGTTASNPTTPDRKSRISHTVIISPKRKSSPGLSETETQPSTPYTPSPDKTSSVVGSTSSGTSKHSPDRTAAVTTSPDRKNWISTTVTISPDRGSSPGLSETGMMTSLHSTSEWGAEGDQSAQAQTAASTSPGSSPGRAGVSGGASLQSVTKATVTPNQSPDRDAVDHLSPARPNTLDQPCEAKAVLTPTHSPKREKTLDDETKFASTTPVGTPERKESSMEQSAPEKDRLDKSKTDPNYSLLQIAAGTSSEPLTPERTNFNMSLEQKNDFAAVPAPPHSEEGTPRVSNQDHSYVDSVSSGLSIGMQQAFHSLRTYMNKETDSEQGAGVLNTSMESDSLTDFDIQELAKEIRELNKSKDEKKDENEMEGEEKQSSPQSSTGKKSAHAPVTLSRAADATALPSRSPAAVLSRSRSRKERMERINNNSALAAATPNKAIVKTPSTTPFYQASSAAPTALISSTPTRASIIRNDGGMTPIMRMRTTGSPESPMLEPSPPRASDDEVKKLKQRKWKDKLKVAERKKEDERRMLDGRGRRKEKESDGEIRGRGRSKTRSKERRKKSSKKKSQAQRKTRGRDANANFMQCTDGFSKLMETVMQSRCGALNDTFSIFDEGSDTDGSSFESESESSSEEYDQEEKGASTDEGELEEEDGELPVWKGGKRRSRGEGVRFEPEAHVAEKDAASGSNQSHLSSELLSRPIGRISLHEEAVEDPGIHDKNFIHEFITNATTKGTVLFLHKKSRKQSFTQPSKMTALLKLGPEQADGSFGGPKFVWMAYDGIQAGRIDLFDIRAVDKATPLQLQHYPLAMPGRSFIIKMNRSPDCVFEAMDEKAALRFVHGMRWVVARLAFNLIIGNMDVSCELLDVGRHEDSKEKTRIPQSPAEEAKWSTAMNSLTNHLVDKASLFTTQ